MGKYASVIDALFVRLRAHNVTGGLLEGWKIETDPKRDTDCEKRLPVLRFWMPDVNEAAGTVKIYDSVLTLRLTMSVKDKVGLSGFLSAAELVMDAVALKADLTKDLSLEGTVVTPMVISFAECFALEASLNAHITIAAVPRPSGPVSRRVSTVPPVKYEEGHGVIGEGGNGGSGSSLEWDVDNNAPTFDDPNRSTINPV